ncbi:MAG: hypothetical protein AUG06_11440 [Actinobacteria bacterium 13_1_20CM_2_65_11]|nr:MAG: hypothetical protein AUG06_11440 [Actinobacteria bacterium 13_1_20CM_2_65_11]
MTTASFSIYSLAVGSHTITASYTSDGNFNLSSGTLTQTVSKADTTTAHTSAVNPTRFGQSTTFTATVSVVSPGTTAVAPPTGTMTFYDGSASLGTGTLSTTGGATTATFSTYKLVVGSHSITVSYNGDGNFNVSTSAPMTQSVLKADTTTTLASSVNPTRFGQSTTFTATVSVVAPGTIAVASPTGMVTFYDGSTSIGSGTLSTSGGVTTASVSTNGLGVGSHSITAGYAGDGNFNISSSAVVTQSVLTADTTTALKSSANPSYWSAPVTFTATVGVVAPGTTAVASPTGMVTFFDGTTSIGSGTLSTAGGVTTASFSTSSLVLGPHPITATYPADGNFNSSTTSALSQSVVVVPVTVNVTPSPTSLQYSDLLTASALIVTPAGTAPPAGSVQFQINGDNFGPAQTVSSSAASFSGQVLRGPSGLTVPGASTLKATFTPADPTHYNASTPGSIGFTLSQEDARAYYTGALLASTGSINSTSANVTLAATIKDITAVPSTDITYIASQNDQYPGDIRNASMTFVNRDTGAVLCTASVGLVSLSDSTVGTATCTSTPLAANSTAGGTQYTIGIIVGGYYTRNMSQDDTVINVYIPQSNFITGGGYLINSSSAGLYPGAPGQRTNFGFNVKYNKSGTNLQGNINVIVRNNGRVYQIKGNSMTSLVVNYCPIPGEPGYQSSGCGTPVSPCTGNASATCPITAVFNGKASIQDITDPLNSISIDGNATLQVTMTDYGTPATSDTIGITVWNKSGGMWFSSHWNTTRTIEQLLDGGALAVH